MAPSVSPRTAFGRAAALACLCLTVLVGACTSGGQAQEEPTLAAVSDPEPPRRRCEVYTRNADIGTTRTTRCVEDTDGDGVADAIEVTRRRASRRPTCVRSERDGDRWRRVAHCDPAR